MQVLHAGHPNWAEKEKAKKKALGKKKVNASQNAQEERWFESNPEWAQKKVAEKADKFSKLKQKEEGHEAEIAKLERDLANAEIVASMEESKAAEAGATSATDLLKNGDGKFDAEKAATKIQAIQRGRQGVIHDMCIFVSCVVPSLRAVSTGVLLNDCWL